MNFRYIGALWRLPIALCLFIAGLLCLDPPARAWWQSIQQISVGGAGYQGPINAAGVSAKGAWGLRCLSAAYCGGNLANVCTVIATVDTCADFGSDTATGNITVGTIGGLSCAAVTCTIKIFYDQSGASACSGACDETQATVASRPLFITSCIGSLPCARSSTGSVMAATLAATSNQPNWISAVVKRTGSFTITQGWFGDADTACDFNSAANQLLLFAGSSLTKSAVADSALHAVQCVMNGASSELYVDGSSTTGAGGASTLSSTINISRDGFGSSLIGDFGEIIFFNSAPDATKNSNVNGNQHTYWGF